MLLVWRFSRPLNARHATNEVMSSAKTAATAIHIDEGRPAGADEERSSVSVVPVSSDAVVASDGSLSGASVGATVSVVVSSSSFIESVSSVAAGKQVLGQFVHRQGRP